MPIELEIIRASEFIRLGAHGKLDLAASRNSLAALARASRVRQIRRALIDVRDVKAELTPDDLATLIKEFGDIGFSRNERLALLHKGDPNLRARLFTLIGRLRGWHMQAFDNEPEARAWLSEDEPGGEPLDPEGGVPIPIHQKPPADG